MNFTLHAFTRLAKISFDYLHLKDFPLNLFLMPEEKENAKILVVDDKVQMREVLRKFLTAENYLVEMASNGIEALEKFKLDSYDLVLSDIKMPAMEGTALLDEILRIKPDQTVILMTAFGSIEAAVEAIRKGATDYVSKPFQMEEILLRIRRVLKERKLEKLVAVLEEKLDEKNALEKSSEHLSR